MTTPKLLPRDPTEAMVEAGMLGAERRYIDLSKADAGEIYRAVHDAAQPLRLKRTEPPTEPGLYLAAFDTCAAVRPVEVSAMPGGLGVEVIGRSTIYHLDAFDWYGPLIVPEIEP